MAAVAHLSPYHFARQFRAATGLAPYQYVIVRRVERAQELLREEDDLCLGEVAFRAGFIDETQLRGIIDHLPKGEYRDYVQIVCDEGTAVSG